MAVTVIAQKVEVIFTIIFNCQDTSGGFFSNMYISSVSDVCIKAHK